ncbi:MAG TPA: NAD(P)/FAD-dependent oxidoreductase [Thermoguttaceae bacterium]|nr:NAD(P)/FAD-dependent oxidoreductase [Thermoguttaceae bacterium]
MRNEQPGTAMYDTIIIGAGMSGLAAGIRLAHFDKRVCILERHSAVGGLNSYYRQNGRLLDVGLHAVTNYVPRGAKHAPLSRLLRQLRFRREDFDLSPQTGSTIRFPGVSLDFSNDFELLASEVNRHFPRQKENFRRLLAELPDYDQYTQAGSRRSARGMVSRFIDDPLLVEMLFCPLLYYGGARQHDMDLAQFSIMFRSIYLEGFARPFAGVRLILDKLVERFQSLGGELRLRSGVSRIAVSDGAAEGVVLDDGTELYARHILSSAGWIETMRLCDDRRGAVPEEAGQLSFVESISFLDAPPQELGLDRTIVFFNDSDEFHYEKPDGLVDLRSGVICSPNNFRYREPLGEGIVRITALANYDRWAALDGPSYREAKRLAYDSVVESVVRFVPDFRGSVVETDVFTPTTIRRYTGHENGAVYGMPDKRYDGTTHLSNLFVCGTDQGLVGIVGSMTSGITMANRHLLKG